MTDTRTVRGFSVRGVVVAPGPLMGMARRGRRWTVTQTARRLGITAERLRELESGLAVDRTALRRIVDGDE